MRLVPLTVALLLALAPGGAAAPGSAPAPVQLTYRILLQDPAQMLLESTSSTGPVIESLSSGGVTMATLELDYGRIALTAGSEAAGPAVPSLVRSANPTGTFEDEIIIEPPTPGDFLSTGTFVSRFELSGTGGAGAGGADVGNTRSRYSFFAQITSCTQGCRFLGTGEWFDFGSMGGGAGFSGDPVASFETGPHSFAFGIPFPIEVSLSLETQATADSEPALAESFADFGGTLEWSIVEVRDGFGDLVDAPVATAQSGAVYVPEPQVDLAAVAVLGLVGGVAARCRPSRATESAC